MEKFNFDRVFSSDGKAAEPAPRARRTFRAEEVEQIRVESFAAGEKSAVAKTEQASAASTSVIAAGVQDVLNSLRVELDLIRDDSTRLAAVIARKFVSHMIEKAPELYLERCIDECLETVHREPEIIVKIPAGSPASLKLRLTALAQRNGLSSGLRIEENPNLKSISCQLSWRSGGAEVSLEQSLARMDEIIEQHIAALAMERTETTQSATA